MTDQKAFKVLYVDDEAINLELFQLSFEDLFEIIVAESGMEGLEIVSQNDGIDLIISDMRMPGISGMEFISRTKQLKPEIPCIILSGYDKSKEIDVALENKLIVDYMMKPFDRNKIQQTINKIALTKQ